MKNKKIILAGGSGFIGQEIAKYFHPDNEIIILTRRIQNTKNNRNSYTESTLPKKNIRLVEWDAKTHGDWSGELNGADLIINLTGKTVNCRYTRKNKKEILESRVNAVKVLGEGVRSCHTAPKLWINASSATIYRFANDKPQDELTGEYHHDFSVQVCQEWEKIFLGQNTPGTRKVALRMAITLGSGGVLIPYFNLLKFGLGGTQGPGRQMYSWVHITDTCKMIDWIVDHPNMEGVYNCCAPNPVNNKVFMETLRRSTGTKFALPAYTWMLKLGAPLIGTSTELVLKSRWVVPTKMLQAGFEFTFPFLENALKDIMSQIPKKQYRLI